MTHLLRALVFLALLSPAAAWAQGVGLFIRSSCSVITSPVTNATYCFESAGGTIKVWDGATYSQIAPGSGGGGGAPDTAKFLVQQAHGSLANAQAMGALATGIVFNTTGTGIQSIYAGTSCTNQFMTALNASGVGTCTTPDLTGQAFANQGTTSTVLHGNGAGVLGWGAVNLSNEISGILAGDNGGTGSSSWQVVGPSGSVKSFTFPNASAVVLTDNAAVTTAQGGTGVSTAPDDNVLVGNGTIWQAKAVPDCDNAVTSKLLYDAATNAWSCGTDQTGGGGGSSVGADADVQLGDGAGNFVVDTGVFQHDRTNHVTTLSGIAPKYVTKSSNYTATRADYFIAVDATAGAVTITLPAATTKTGLVFVVKKVDSSANAVTVARTGADTIDGDTSAVMPAQNTAASFISDGTSKWFIY